MLAPLVLLLAVSAPDATLSRTRVPATGAQESLLTVTRFGRVSLVAKNKRGASLQLIDKSFGPGPIEEGRLDVFLDRGTYKIIVRGNEGEEPVELSAHHAEEKNMPRPPMLVELKPVEATLTDFQQRSYWIEIAERRTISLEAAGRSLADLRLYKDGTWLLDAVPSASRAEPKATQPLKVLQLTAELEPGLYLLTAYGGTAEPWAEESPNYPFYLRWEIPKYPEAGRKRMTIGPLGYDRMLIPRADYFRIELPEARPLSMSVDGASAAISKNSIPPVAELHTASGLSGDRSVLITGEAGQNYIFQWFGRSNRSLISERGEFYVSTVTAGHPEDELDSTAVLIPYSYSFSTYQPLSHSAVVRLDDDTSWVRRFNLLQPATIFFYVAEAGRYRLQRKNGGTAKFRFEPMLLDRPAIYRAPPFVSMPGVAELDRGYWILSLEPEQKGVIELELSRQSIRVPLIGDPESSKSPLTGLRIPKLTVPADTRYWVWSNQVPGVTSGMIIRRLPLELRDPLAVIQDPRELLGFDFVAGEAGSVRAEAEDGTLLSISVDGRERTTLARIEAGAHRVEVHASGEKLVSYSLGFFPRTLEKDTPLPQLPDARFAALPDFPVLAAKQPYYFDLQRASAKTFLLRAAQPGLYRVESSGLLETAAVLRSRMHTNLAEVGANGVGRNFLLEQYLGTGDYQIHVSTRGMSRGHLGVHLGETKLIDGGKLREKIPARVTIPGGTAAIFPFEIAREGTYHLRAMTAGRVLRARLEDHEGWPIIQPGLAADQSLQLSPGKYRLIVLPEPVEVRALALFTPETQELEYSGKGPHRLPLDASITHVWEEKGRGRERRPDRFTFELPARDLLDLRLEETMRAQLIRLDKNNAREIIAEISGGGWSGTVDRGNYLLEIFCARENDQVEYQLSLRPSALMAGMTRQIPLPATLTIAAGDDRGFELSSFGAGDVRARLFDERGRLLAENDDRPDDWNFLLAARTPAGNYRLVVEPVGEAREETSVTMRVRAELEQPKISLPFAADLRLEENVRVLTFDPPAEPLLILSVRSPETTALSLEAELTSGQWITLGTQVGRPAQLEVLALSAGTARRYRARTWSADQRGLTAKISILAAVPEVISEEDLAAGVELSRIPNTSLAAVKVELARPGTFAVEGSEPTRSTGSAGSSFLELHRDRATSETRALYFVRHAGAGRDPAGGQVELRAQRVSLYAESSALEIRAGRALLADLPKPDATHPVLVEAESMGAVGIALGESQPDLGSIALRERAALAVHLDPATHLARFWALEEPHAPLELRARAARFELRDPQTIAAGLSAGELSARTATQLNLPSGAKSVRLTLEDGAAAALITGDRVEQVFWAEGSEELLETAAASVLIFNPLDRPLRWSVELVRQPVLAVRSLSAGTALELMRAQAGALRLEIPAGKPNRTLRIRGAVESALYLSTGGTAVRGFDLALDGRPGVLYLRTRVGLLVTWLEDQGDRGRALFGVAPLPEPMRVDGELSLALRGRSAAFRFETTEPRILHLRTGSAVVSRAGKNEPLFHPHGASLDVYLPKGRTDLALRALLGGELQGEATFTTSPIAELSEGLGPEVMLSPGTMRVFRFSLPKKSSIGAGVRADSAEVEAVLMDSEGTTITRGVTHLTALEPGNYLLGLRASESSAPARARPAIAGLTAPPNQPPLEIIENYLHAAD